MDKTKKTLKIIITLIIVVIMFTLSCMFIKMFVPVLTINKGNIELDYKEKYKEYGAKLYINRKDYSKRIKIVGKVNSKKLGKYIVKYIYKDKLFNIVRKRTVIVKDKTKPAIVLTGVKDTYICPNSKYSEEGYKAIDNYDGDITKNVKVKNEDSKITYTVRDSSNNKTVLVRNIIEKDIVKPVVDLKGYNNMNIYLGEDYNEPGFVANDNCEGNITDKVEVTNNIDKNKLGTYKVTYTVKDKYSNSTTVERVVNVIKKHTGVIYLTFDDGPKEGTTNVILDILKEEGVKATFFVTNNGEDYLIKREYDEGHTVALHTATHQYSIYTSAETYFNDLKAVSDRVYNITGYRANIIRFPGGSSNTISRRYNVGIMSYLTKEVLNRGYKYYDWNISSGDAGGARTAEEVYSNVVNNLSKDKVNMILMHDIKPYTRDAIRNIIKYGKENGYSFAKIDETTEMVTQRVNN